ncbi:acylneuraminate cytidylyltransferase family protein [Leptospira jelokensis]|uniref:acylneuraminate cytidylyltransferase family protein n=1 Tax=Leptospira jelokensis TaxID=2484931 RepID=UPI0010913D40|nr:acylneuraminate cytidylyltransferase family protein [Leptospira jelokensis]TGL99198.1 acylneuraminate cytidylyltransferase family protein [Leptospira jelokensis]
MILHGQKILGLVGIRSGSKGVKDKNIRMLKGKPLVYWILNAAKSSKYINRIIVSTDTERYANIAKDCGAEVPYLRPENLATDSSPEVEYVAHMLNWLKEFQGYEPDIVIRLMATVPLQISADIDALVEILMKDPKADSAVAISPARQHPYKALKIVDDGMGSTKLLSYFGDSGREVTPISRQSYPSAYFRANIIAFRTNVLERTNSLTGDLVRYHIIPQERAIDIDNEIDFKIAELLMSELNEI